MISYLSFEELIKQNSIIFIMLVKYELRRFVNHNLYKTLQLNLNGNYLSDNKILFCIVCIYKLSTKAPKS